MGILISEKHKLYPLAAVTKNAENDVSSYLKDRSGELKEKLKVLKKYNLHEIYDSLERSAATEQTYYEIYKSTGLADKTLEYNFKKSKEDNLLDNFLLHPIENSKSIEDIFYDIDISRRFDDFFGKIENYEDDTRKKKIKKWLDSELKPETLRGNLKGMLAKKAKIKSTFSATISLSRSTKNQKKLEGRNDEEKYDLVSACEEINHKHQKILNFIAVWFRIKDRGIFWRHKVAVFSPSVFLIKNPNEFKKAGKKQYKYENHGKFTYLTINPAASYQFNCVCRNINEFIKEANAEVIYDSWTQDASS